MFPVSEALPISRLRYHQADFLARIEKREQVVLTVRGHGIAVVVHPEIWNSLLERLKNCEEKLQQQ